MCPTETGLMSRNAKKSASSWTMCAGISLFTILQKIQEFIPSSIW
ncbi:MAG: hypothetical protein RLZZ347_529 [Candidatus Parcubacteria bacterium]